MSRRPIPSRRLLAVAAGVLALASACSLPEDAEPREIPKSDLPAALTPGPSVPDEQAAAGGQVVYLVRSVDGREQLVPVSVSLPSDRKGTAMDEAKSLVERLVLNPPVSPGSDLASAIPPGTPAPITSAAGDVLVVDLPALATIEGPRQRQAVAQVVFTATSVPGVAGVRFTADGKDVSVPVDGRAADPGEVLTRSNFPTLRS